MRARVGVTGGREVLLRESGPREIGHGPPVCSPAEGLGSGHP